MKKKKPIISCKKCKKKFGVFPSRLGKRKYCSNKCSNADRIGFIQVGRNCKICKKVFTVNSQLRLNDKTCSQKCQEENRNQISHKRGKERAPKKCRRCQKKYVALKHHHGLQLCKPCVFNRSSENRIGAKNPNWRGGSSSELELARKGRKYGWWKKRVHVKSNYTCQVCGISNVTLDADHVKPFAIYPELRYEVSNGRSVCRPCHRKTKSWGSRRRELMELERNAKHTTKT